MKNIVMFFCDELRTDALGCYGGNYPQSLTPNLDGIAKQGTLFTNCFCSSPLCVPSRTSILTGLSPLETGVLSNEAAFEGYRMEHSLTTFPQELAAAGYKTASFGKTHLPPEMSPFQVDVKAGGEMDFMKLVQTPLIRPAGCPTVIGGVYPSDTYYLPEQVTDNTIAYLKQSKGPFFLRVSFLQPHTPVVIPWELTGRLEELQLPKIDRTLPASSCFERRFATIIDSSNLSEEQLLLCRKYYYLLVHWVDIQVGRIIRELKKSGLYENTILVVHADHGASLGEHGLFAKHIFAPQVHRVPLIISDTERKHSVSDQLCSGMDLAKTLTELVGHGMHSQYQGMNLFDSKRRRSLISAVGYGRPGSVAFPYKKFGKYDGNKGWPMRCCIRTEQFRLDLNMKIDGKSAEADRDLFFCDYTKDREEQTNLSQDPDYQQQIRQLLSEMEGMVNQYER